MYNEHSFKFLIKSQRTLPSVFIKPLRMSLDVNISEPDEFNCNELHSCIKYIAKLKGVEDFAYHVDYICGKGENFIANIFRVLIKESDTEDNSFSVIVKTLINTSRQELFHELHAREVTAYNKVIQKYNDLQKTINAEETITFPQCLYTRIEKGNEVIILEDLKAKGYGRDNASSSFEPLDYTQVGVVLKGLAKFHGLSFIYEKHDPKSFTEITSELSDIIFSNGFLNKSKLRNYFQESFGMSISLVDDLEAKEKLVKLEDRITDILREYVKPKRTNVLCHGDCWINNVMLKTEDEEEAKVCFLDFQAMRYANPMTDVLHFLYLSTDSAFRTAHMDDLLTLYYDNLKSFLNLYNIDVNLVYTKENFDEDLKDTLSYGLIMALIEMRLMTTTAEDEAVLKGAAIVPRSEMSEVPGEVNYYKIRVNDVVKESVDNGVLDLLVERCSNC